MKLNEWEIKGCEITHTTIHEAGPLTLKLGPAGPKPSGFLQACIDGIIPDSVIAMFGDGLARGETNTLHAGIRSEDMSGVGEATELATDLQRGVGSGSLDGLLVDRSS